MKLDMTVTASTRVTDFSDSWRIEVKPNQTVYRSLVLPKGFKGWIARTLGIPVVVTFEIGKARPGPRPKL